MLLKTGVQPIEVQVMQRVYRFMTKGKYMPNHRFPKQAWNIGCEVQ